MPSLAVVVNWMEIVPPGPTPSVGMFCVKRKYPVGGVGSGCQFNVTGPGFVAATETALSVPPCAGMATVTLRRVFVLGAAALLTVNVYAVEAPSDAEFGLMLAVYTTMTVIAGLVLAVIALSVTSEAVSVVLAGLSLTVTSVTLNVPVPNANAAFAGKCACASFEVI